MPDHLILPVDHIIPALFKGNGRGKKIIPDIPDRLQHSQKLTSDIRKIQEDHRNELVYTIKFNGNTNTGLLFDFLDQQKFGMELLSINETDGKITSANVRIDSYKALKRLRSLLNKYSLSNIGDTTLPYIGSISSISGDISVSDLFMDDKELIPKDNKKHWWEIWIIYKGENSTNNFISATQRNKLKINERFRIFPSRAVFIVEATLSELDVFVKKCNLIAEIHLAKTIKSSVTDLKEIDQQKLINELLQKISYKDSNVCITVLDSGLIARHDLLNPAIIQNLKAVDSFTDDPKNLHTTSIGSLAILGDINEIKNMDNIDINHKIESVQILDSQGTDPELWGAITNIAVTKTDRPNIINAYVMPVTADNNTGSHYGAPTSWSADLDQIIFNSHKLFTVSVGNINDNVKKDDYENHQKNSCIEDPAQSWNAISVGSYTNLSNAAVCSGDGFMPLADFGDISPYSKTSYLFEKHWPIKPEVVFEGGNRVTDACMDVFDGTGFFDLAACSPTLNNPSFVRTAMTSASTGLSGKFLGELIAKYPNLWAETIRGLMIHSAEWTDSMKAKLPGAAKQGDLTSFIRTVGYGVPNLERAKNSLLNDLTIIIEKEFQVYDYKKDKNNVIPIKKRNREKINNKVCQILTIPLPIPCDILQSDLMQNKDIKVKFTLSYFTEPNPSSRGYVKKFSYRSHNLRFELQMPGESDDNFIRRINANIIDEDEETPEIIRQKDDRKWIFGKKSEMRVGGSIHQDILETNGANLAGMKNIAIYSVGGWWRDSLKRKPEDTLSRFSLIISIDASSVDIDLYSLIENQIQIITPVAVSV